MTTGSIPLALIYSAPRQPVSRWVAGSISIALAIVASLLTLLGHGVWNGAAGIFSDVWVGAMLAVLSIATAVAGLACGAADATLGRGDRTMSILGVVMNLTFGLLFYALWL